MTDEKRIKTTKTRFNFFRKCFLEYADRFGLLGWDMEFAYTNKKGEKACVEYDFNTCNALISVNDMLPESTNLKELARHEAIHLMLAGTDFVAAMRCVTPEELTRANEEVTVKLTKLIR